MPAAPELFDGSGKLIGIVVAKGSGTGIEAAANGTCDIGLASRALKDSELEQGVVGTVIANDGIAVIVNNESTVTGLTSEQVKGIYMGELTNWSEVA